MTVTVNVRTRAVGATVKVGTQDEVRIPARSDRDFAVDGNASITVTEAEPSADEPAIDTSKTSEDAASLDAGFGKFDHDGDGRPGGSLPKKSDKKD